MGGPLATTCGHARGPRTTAAGNMSQAHRPVGTPHPTTVEQVLDSITEWLGVQGFQVRVWGKGVVCHMPITTVMAILTPIEGMKP